MCGKGFCLLWACMLLALGTAYSAQSARGGRNDLACEREIPPITSGYGADGAFVVDHKIVLSGTRPVNPVSVFVPRRPGRLPVVFFSHGYSGKNWHIPYKELMLHLASRGYLVVFSPYPTVLEDVSGRYDILWRGFDKAVRKFGGQMDLSRVGFVGHSFGGGATPAMAYKGVVERGWGGMGAFMFVMAPWYVFEVTPQQLTRFPAHLMQVMQIYDQDDVNDHRMAIDLHRNTLLPEANRYFLEVRSQRLGECDAVAGHKLPARAEDEPLKRYAVFRPLDAVAELVFDADNGGRNFIEGLNQMAETAVFQPVHLRAQPEPEVPQADFKFPWNDPQNPRRELESW